MRRKPKRKAGEIRYELGRGAVYSRISNPGDDREASLETQERAIMARLRAEGYEVTDADIFRDKFTGKETLRRKELNRMRDLVRQGVYKAVGVYKLDRLARNQGHTYLLLGELDELAVKPLSVLEPNIEDTPLGKMARMMGAYMAEAELATLDDRFGRGREHIAERGRPLGRGHAPYGYKFVKKPDRVFVLDEDDEDHEGTARWARLIFEMMAGGASAHAVAVHLNANRVKTPGDSRGLKYKKAHTGLWSGNVIAKMVKNPAYKGWSVEGKFYTEGVTDEGHSVMRAIDPEDWVVHDRDGRIMPRMVDEATWDAANATLARNASNRGSNARHAQLHALAGMIRCRLCGAKMYPYRNRHGNSIYRCSRGTLVPSHRQPGASRCEGRHVRGVWIDALVWGQLKALLLTPGRLESAIVKMLGETDGDTTRADLVRAEATLAEHTRLRDKFFKKLREEEAREEPDADLVANWDREYRGLKGPIDAMKKTVDSLRALAGAMVSPERVAAEASARFQSLRDRLAGGDDTTAEERREAMLLARTRVVVTGNGRRSAGLGGEGEIHFYLFDEGAQATPSPARWRRLAYLVKIGVTPECIIA